MMMLVVFTAFLGMELKTAVGTSTFIMTFTALIASVSHILIHPAILLEKWHVMILCIAVATVSSLVSARFANRVNNRTVGLVTGAVLTFLGGSMLLLNFWPQISAFALPVQTLKCFGRLLLYIIPCVLAFTCFTIMMLAAECWQSAALTSVLIAVLVYPLLSLFEQENWYGKLFVEKSPGEIKRSLLMLFFMFAAVISVSWGLFHNPHAAATSILMWGVGDAAAALVGIPFGKHKVNIGPMRGRKSWEGSCAMFLISTLVGLGVLWLHFGYSAEKSLLCALTMAAAGTVTEMISPSEWDTITVPVTMLIIALIV